MKLFAKRSLWLRFMIWQAKKINHRTFIRLAAVIIGILSGIAAVIIKNAVHFINKLVTSGFSLTHENFLYFALPAIGILLAVLFVRFVIRDPVGHGVPSILYAISRNNGVIRRHNTFSSIISSTLTVGFGGSVGLEGPSVFTGAAIGSNVAQVLRLGYKDMVLLMALACSGALAAIFKSPIAAIVFSVEVIMIDLTMASVIPLLIASVTAVLTSYFFLGSAVLYPFEIQQMLLMKHIPYYILLGVFAGITSVYFTRIYIFVENQFTRVKRWWVRWLAGGVIMGVLVFFFPSLFGEGYEAINTCLKGDYSPLFNESPFYFLRDSMSWVFIMFVLVLFFKVIATAVTFGAGGVGGIFAPALFMGVFAGLFFAELIKFSGLTDLPESNFAMVGMGGLIAGVLHAPLTGIFMVAEITGGYGQIVPLMIVCTLSYATVKLFVPNSVYTHQLAKRGELITHDKDKSVMSLMRVDKLIEKDFLPVDVEATLRDLVKIISESNRNIYPIVDKENNFKGFIRLDDIRNIMFKPELYDDIRVTSLMVTPATHVEPGESMDTVAQKFMDYDKYNLPVLKEGKYVGFISRANVFSSYRKIVKDFSEE
jgi:CIC family chloride channel protein